MSGDGSRYERFAATLGDAYAVGGDAALQLTLVEATPRASGSPTAPDGTAFTLLFRGPLDPMLGQGILPLSHPRLGRLEIFVVPVERRPDGMRYEAVFG